MLTPGTTGSVFFPKISGGQNYASEVLLDGADIERSENGSNFDELAPSVEAIQKFKVIASTLPAEFGRTTGGVQSFTIKSGTNQFHGGVYEILQNEDLNANSWFNNARADIRFDDIAISH